jgi:four helix bundle protein
MRLTAVSLPANIAEEHGAVGKGQFRRCLNIAQGSLAEVENDLVLSSGLSYISDEQNHEAEDLRPEVGFLLNRLIRSLKR